jgi:SAM-dependent methyltransferase
VSASDLERWDQIASTYAAATGGEHDSFYRRLAPFLRTQIGDDLEGRHVLDLGCGHGWLGARLAASGADVVGVDGSQALIQQAQTSHPQLTWHVHDLTEPLPDSWGPFDIVVAHMVLMDLPALHELLTGVSQLLLPNGTFVFTILHPSFFNQPILESPPRGWVRAVDGYLDHEVWDIDSFGGHRHYHRPLCWYLQRLFDHGFVITGIDEPATLPPHSRPSKDWTDYERWFSRIPTMISIACRHAAPPNKG